MLTENAVALTQKLVASFGVWWRALVPEGLWREKIVYPYRHLVHEKFWTLEKNG